MLKLHQNAKSSVAGVDLLGIVQTLQADLRSKCAAERQRELGQYFTPVSIARFMASLLGDLPEKVRILDPGAGAGILTAAICERISCMDKPREVEIHAFENDAAVLETLYATLAECQSLLESYGHNMRFSVHPKDFILQGPNVCDANDLFGSTGEAGFDVVIMNPPYFKIAKDSAYARAMANVVHGQPNLYALFMALGVSVLSKGGQFVGITPRSFANGPYFRKFRRWFLSRMSIRRLHLFESRREAFSESEVLQENVITYAIKEDTSAHEVVISHSEGRNVPNPPQSISVAPSLMIDDSGRDAIIRMPVSEEDVSILRAVEAWPNRFEEHGLRVSTGPIVTFRAVEHIDRGPALNGGIPLLSVQNVYPFRTVWPARTERKTLSFQVTPDSEKLLIPSSNYVLIRRFSAKDEDRCLTASPVFHDTFAGQWLALENHLNYIYHADRNLSEAEVMGIVVMLNSMVLDVYFRTISGNTQVNAAEVRRMPFPSLSILESLGSAVAVGGGVDRKKLESIVLHTLGINGHIRSYLLDRIPNTTTLERESATDEHG